MTKRRMIFPKAMPDEWVKGLLCRFAILNSLGSSSKLNNEMERIRSSLSNSSTTSMTWCEILANANQMSLNTFLAHHTLLPFNRAVRPPLTSQPFGCITERFDRFAHQQTSHANGTSQYLCPNCVNEDMSFWGFSYWRRSHQLRGAVLCHKHQVGLLESTSCLWIDLPHHVIDDAKPIPSEIVSHALQDPVLQRYADIALAFAERKQPITTTWIAHILHQKLRSRTSADKQVLPRLTTIANAMINGPWQQHFFPELSKGNVADDLNSLDRTRSCKPKALSTPFYVLALSLLFNSADSAICAVSNSSSEELPRTQGQTRVSLDLPAAVATFLGGATISDTARSHGLDIGELEALLRIAMAPLSELLSRQH